MRELINNIEQVSGSTQTYVAAAATAGVGAWFGDNWFLVLSAVAVLVRLAIDVPKLVVIYRKKKNGQADPE